MKSATLNALENYVLSIELALRNVLHDNPAAMKDVEDTGKELKYALGDEKVD